MRRASFRKSMGNGRSVSSRRDCSASAWSAPTRNPALRNFSASASKSSPRNIQSRRSLSGSVNEVLLYRLEDRVVDFNILSRWQVDFNVVPQLQNISMPGERHLLLGQLRLFFGFSITTYQSVRLMVHVCQIQKREERHGLEFGKPVSRVMAGLEKPFDGLAIVLRRLGVDVE